MNNKKLNVWYEDNLVGFLYENSNQKLIFEYSNDWFQSPKQFPISHSMPLNTYSIDEKVFL